MKLVGLVVLGATFVGASACPSSGDEPERSDAGVAERRHVVVDAGPRDGGVAYPQGPSLTAEQLAAILPKSDAGQPIVAIVGGSALTLGPPRRDAIGAAAACTDLLTSCLRVTRDNDRCIAEVPRCRTAEPWNEASACCASACVDAYQEQRRLGASVDDADSAVFGSTHECFPGLQAQYRAAGGTPYLAPRRRAP